MKIKKFLIFIIFLSNFPLLAQDSTLFKKVIKLETESANNIKSFADFKKTQDSLKDIIKKLSVNDSLLAIAKTDSNDLSFFQKIYCLSPQLILILGFLFINFRLNKKGFNLSEALTSDEPATYVDTSLTPPVTKTVLDDNKNPIFVKSASRYIALFSGLAAIVIASSIVSANIYFSLKGTAVPAFDKTFEIILGLGIGIVPYAFNKATENK